MRVSDVSRFSSEHSEPVLETPLMAAFPCKTQLLLMSIIDHFINSGKKKPY